MLSPLRKSILFLGTIGPWWQAGAVAHLARCTQARARAYVRQLSDSGVLTVDSGWVGRGARWESWRIEPADTHAGGHARYYYEVVRRAQEYEPRMMSQTQTDVARMQAELVDDLESRLYVPWPAHLRGVIARIRQGRRVANIEIKRILAWRNG